MCRWQVRQHSGKGYLLVNASPVRSTPAIMEAIGHRLHLPQKQVAVHRLVAVLGRGADLSRGGEVHHTGLNRGDNRAEALAALSGTTHQALHRHIDGLDALELEAYLASVPDSLGGLGALPCELLERVLVDLATFEGAMRVIPPRAV